MPTRPRGRIPPTAWLTAEKLIQQGLWLVLFTVLGPLLGPKPYGLVSLAMVFAGSFELILAEAAAEALLTLRTASAAHFATANAVNLAAAGAASLAMAGFAWPLAAVLRDPALLGVMLALSPLPIVAAATAAPSAALRRERRFSTFALRSSLGLGVGGVCGVAAALLGAGVYALVIQLLVQRGAEAAILLAASRSSRRIGFSRSALADLWTCGVNVAIAKTWVSLAAQAPRLVVGAILGPGVLGLFNIAQRIPDVLIQIVLVPATQIARLDLRDTEGGGPEFARQFERLLGDLALITFPVATGAAATSSCLFDAWLGAKWSAAAPATAVLALSILPWTLLYGASAALLALRLSHIERQVQQALALGSAAAALLAAPFGLTAICLVLLARLLLLLLLPFRALRREAGVAPIAVLRTVAGPLIAAGLMGALVAVSLPAAERAFGPAALLPLAGEGVLLYALFAGLFARRQAVRLIGALAAGRPRPAPATA